MSLQLLHTYIVGGGSWPAIVLVSFRKKKKLLCLCRAIHAYERGIKLARVVEEHMLVSLG